MCEASPLSLFQHTTFQKDDFFKLVKAINEVQKENKRDDISLQTLFDTLWPKLEECVKLAATKGENTPQAKRDVEDMVREILDVTNTIARTMPKAFTPREFTSQVGFQSYAEANTRL